MVKQIQPKTIKKSYHVNEIVRAMFKERVSQKTKEIAKCLNKQPFLVSKAAVKEVRENLNKLEKKLVEQKHAEWNSGKIKSEADRRL